MRLACGCLTRFTSKRPSAFLFSSPQSRNTRNGQGIWIGAPVGKLYTSFAPLHYEYSREQEQAGISDLDF
jgi:hypothetical protein